jgi:ADP-ribosyl-[dinitrogen reductase] hydrolase
MADTLDRYHGALLGLAAGDALGTTLEFTPRAAVRPIDDMIGGGPFRLAPGQWTDDTSMAMCLAESLLERGFDARDQMARYLRWWREGYWSSTGECFDIGGTVSAALQRFERTGDPIAGSTDPQSAGNGSLMRLAPVVLRYARDPVLAVRLAAHSSKTTHGAVEAVDACRFFAALIAGALDGRSKEALLSSSFAPPGVDWGVHPLAPSIAAIAAGSYTHKAAADIRASGYVVHTLEAALWAFFHSNDFREGALLAVNLGEDADTTGAVYGQLAGAYYGASGIPDAWRGRLARHDDIVRIATGLLERATEGTGRPMPRDTAARLGQQVLRILETGRYTTASGGEVDVREAIEACRAATVEYPPDADVAAPAPRESRTRISVENRTVLEVGRRMAESGSVAALNFASATHPGGGFLSGARAQEEAIARSSALYAALEGRQMYAWHREHGDTLHDGWVIVSPDVPVFRTDQGELLDAPWTMTIVTCPAVNATALEQFGPAERLADVPAVMRRRTARMLSVAAHHGVRRFVLGAWGCGVFGLDPAMMAGTFRDALEGPFRGVFDEVAFAITDWSPDQRTIGPFQRAFEAGQVYDNSDLSGPRLIASGAAGTPSVIVAPDAWNAVKEHVT